MRENDGRKLDHRTLEAIRLRAVEQVDAGVPAAQVGRGLAAPGLHRRTIYTWLTKDRAEGRAALRAKPVPGRRRKLTDAQLGEVIDKTDPRDHGFAVALWTREIVRQLIKARFGVELTVASVGRTLHDLGFSAQRPLYRAEQADPAAVAACKQVEYPTIAAASKAAGGTVLFVDEAGGAFGRPRRHHLGAGRADPDGDRYRRPVRTEHDLGDQREGRAAVRGVHRQVHRRRVHRLPPPPAPRRRARRRRAGVRHGRRPSGASRPGGRQLRRLHRRGAAAVPAAGLLSAAQSGRVGVEQRQGRPGWPRPPEGSRAEEGGRGRPAAPAAAPTARRPRLLRRPRAELHRSRRLKSTYEQSPWVIPSDRGRLSITATPDRSKLATPKDHVLA